MKILLLRRGEERYPNERELEDFSGHELDVLELDANQQQDLAATLNSHDLVSFDRIVLRLKFDFIRNQAGFLGSLKNLNIIEEDSTGNFFFNSRFLKFEHFFHQLPNARFLVTGHASAEKFRSQGINAVFVPKAFDEQSLYFEKPVLERSIEHGFVGATGGKLYKKRRQFLNEIGSRIDLQLHRTEGKTAYRDMLNEIRFFITSDVGFDEYMIKNFEALACGCILVTNRLEGAEELGFKDMKNVVLYRSVEEALEKISRIRSSPELMKTISQNAVQLARERHTQAIRNQRLQHEILAPMPTRPAQDRRSPLRRLASWLRHGRKG